METHGNDKTCNDKYVAVIDDEYVRTFCSRYLGRGIEFEELYALAKEGVSRALAVYDSYESKRPFNTVAIQWLQERIYQRLKDLAKQKISQESNS